jgi:KDO2-lipid IV(A) lauroyltransferase
LLLAAVTGVCRTLPLGTGYRLADFASRLHHALARGRRRAVAANLRILIGRPGDLPVPTVFRNYGRFVFERLRGPERMAPARLVGGDRLAAARARGRGVVLALPHTGNFEICGATAARLGFPIHAVAGVQMTRRWSSQIARRQASAGLPILSPGLSTWRRLPRMLARNEVLALVVDGDVYRGGHVVDAFGAPVRFPLGPAKLCARTGAALIPVYAVRTPGGGHVAHFLEEIPVAELGIVRATEVLAERLAAVLRDHPDQWMIFRPFFAVAAAS